MPTGGPSLVEGLSPEEIVFNIEDRTGDDGLAREIGLRGQATAYIFLSHGN